MEKLPEDVMIEKILLKLPANSLVNLRYVSKDLWRLITSPSFTKLHFQYHSSIAQLNNNNHNLLMICSREFVPGHVYRSCGTTLALKPVIHNYACNFPPIITTTSTSPIIKIAEMHLPFESTEIRASCNGLLYLHQRLISWIDGRQINDISNYIWNPCTKEYKELPPPPPPSLLVDVGNYCSSSDFCGFGYDRNNDEYKILHYENRVNGRFDYDIQSISSIIEFKLYTLGTNTWTLIVDNPYRTFYFKEGPSKEIGFLVNGALHWIMSPSGIRSKGKIISFDIEKEVFREVQKPRRYYSPSKEEEEEDYYNYNYNYNYYYESLQILQECLCMCQIHLHGGGRGGGVNKIDIWMLQDYDVLDSWTKLFRVVIPDKEFDYNHFRLLRHYENGEIVMLRNAEDVIVYNPVNHKTRSCAKNFNEFIPKFWKYYMNYTESLVCLNSGTYTTDNGMRKRPHIDNTIINCIIDDLTQHNPQKEGDSSDNILNGKKRKIKDTDRAS